MKLLIVCVVVAALATISLSSPVLLDDDASEFLDDDVAVLSSSEESNAACPAAQNRQPAGAPALPTTKCPVNQYWKFIMLPPPNLRDSETSGWQSRYECSPCPSGTSADGKTVVLRCSSKCLQNEYGTSSCQKCPWNSISDPGSMYLSDCRCPRCPANHYLSGPRYDSKVVHSDNKCIPCGAGGTSDGSSDCQGVKCPANEYKSGNDCVKCPSHLTSSAESTSRESCRCPGSTYPDTSSSCKSCPSGATYNRASMHSTEKGSGIPCKCQKGQMYKQVDGANYICAENP